MQNLASLQLSLTTRSSKAIIPTRTLLSTMATINPPTISLSSLKFIKPAELADTLQNSETTSKTAVIDVRDNDHIGGHIKGSQWVPSDQFDARMPELLRVNKDMEKVVFHCMLSQQRGPKAALAYARAKAYEAEKRRVESGMKSEGDGDKGVKEGNGLIGGQQICVLEGGFGNWQAFYGSDKKLTEGYKKDLWE